MPSQIRPIEICLAFALAACGLAGFIFGELELTGLAGQRNVTKASDVDDRQTGHATRLRGTSLGISNTEFADSNSPAMSLSALAIREGTFAQIHALMLNGFLKNAPGRSGSNIKYALDSRRRMPAYGIDYDGKLSPRFGDLFRLDASEVARLQERLTAVHDDLFSFIRSNTLVHQTTPTSLMIDVVGQANGDNYRDQFLGALREVLGDQRYQGFADLSGEQNTTVRADGRREVHGPETYYDAFGTISKHMTITKEAGLYHYEITRTDLDGKILSHEMSSSSKISEGLISSALGPSLQLLPPGF